MGYNDGLFWKYSICKRCGGYYIYRAEILFTGYCEECDEIASLEKERLIQDFCGYVEYRDEYSLEELSVEQLKQLPNHVIKLLKSNYNGLVETFDIEQVLKSYSSKVAENIDRDAVLEIFKQSTYVTDGGISRAGNLISLNNYPSVFVDARDVFAVSYTIDPKFLQCADSVRINAYTKDPYVPMFVYYKSLEDSEVSVDTITVGKKHRAVGITKIIRELRRDYPNLKYHIFENSELKEVVKKSNSKAPDNSKKELLNYISRSLGYCPEIIDINFEILDSSKRIFEDMGYIEAYE